VLAAAAASGGDAGDEYEELLERRDELLRLQGDELREGLNTDEDEELADLTERGCCAAAAAALLFVPPALQLTRVGATPSATASAAAG
jgi:hypothetical protein